MSRTSLTAALVAIALVAIALAVWNRDRDRPVPEAVDRPADGELTIALAGDAVVTSRLPSIDGDPGFARVVATLRSASLAIANLELALSDGTPHGDRSPSAWPVGTRAEAAELHRLGFDAVTRANNHAGDLGVEGLQRTGAALDAAGLRHAGVGDDLDRARAAAVIEVGDRRVALISVAVSTAPESRATPARGEIRGRPGVNALRYTANITVDPKTFETLQTSAPALQPDAQVQDAELTLFGRTIKKGEKTAVGFAVEASDQEEILAQVTAARGTDAIVILAVHSHEPSNHSEEPAEFVRQFARAAIDRGASLVFGHGPHRLRGVEVYNGGVILYSLGNFLFPFEPLASRDADVYDAGVDLYMLALGGVDRENRWTPSPVDAAPWWESVVAVAAFKDGELSRVRLQPIDLGVDLTPERRGIPRAATGSRGAAILERVARLSAALNTPIRIDGDTAAIDVTPRREP